jgi:CHAT domain-containing protein
VNRAATAAQLSRDQLAELSRLPAAELNTWLDRDPELANGGVVEQLGEAVRLLVRVDPDEALRFAEAALTIAARSHDCAQLGRATRAKANSLWYKGHLEESVKLFQLAVEHFETAGAMAEVGRTLSSCIQPLALLGDYSRAFEAAERARIIFLQADDHWRLARLEINVANIHHRQDRFKEALASYQRAYEELLPHKDTEAIAVALHNMAVCLIALNDFENAMQVYRRARHLSESNGMPRLAAQADYNIAYLHFLRGDYQVAIDLLRATRELCERTGDSYHAALCDLDQSEIYLELNLADEAAATAKQAQEQFDKLKMPFESGRALFHRAVASHLLNASTAALSLFGEAWEVFAQEGNPAWKALIGLYRGLVLLETGEAEQAGRICSDAALYFEQSGLHRRSILCRLVLARVAQSTGNLEEAEEHCRRAVDRLAGAEAPLLAYQAHALLGKIRQARGDSASAFEWFQKARREVESLRTCLQGEELKIAFMKNRLEVYERLVGICLHRPELKAAESAFDYVEEAKSRSLLDLIYGRVTPRFWTGNSIAHADRIHTLRQELNWFYRRLDIEQTRPEGISLSEINNLRQQAQRREKEIERIFRAENRPPISPALDAKNPADLKQVRAALGPDASLLEFFQVGSRFVAMVVTQEDLRLTELGSIAEVTDSIRMLEFQLSRLRVKGLESTDVEQFLLETVRSRLQELYRQLVAPIAKWLRGSHVVIVPHAVLHCLPFHALADGDSYVIDRFTVSYAPSAGIYSVCQQRNSSSSGPALLMGVDSPGANRIRQEIRAVAATLKDPDIRLGREATSKVLREVGPTSRLIHIATHGIFRRDNPLFSSVRLADSYLTMYDLYQLNLPVGLLTLSGCGTGLGVVAAGDELLGLMRGVLLAGAQSLLATLWNVDDRSTARFMSLFYEHLQSHTDPAAALQHAMRELRRRQPHPFYWAPFVLVGKSTVADN